MQAPRPRRLPQEERRRSLSTRLPPPAARKTLPDHPCTARRLMLPPMSGRARGRCSGVTSAGATRPDGTAGEVWRHMEHLGSDGQSAAGIPVDDRPTGPNLSGSGRHPASIGQSVGVFDEPGDAKATEVTGFAEAISGSTNQIVETLRAFASAEWPGSRSFTLRTGSTRSNASPSSPLWSGSARTAPVASPTIAGAIVLLPRGDPPLSSFDSCRDDLESPVG